MPFFREMRVDYRSWVVWALLAAACAFDVVAWYPGAMRFDSAFLWWQVRGGESNDVGSPALLWLWRGLDPIVAGPAPIFLLHLGLFWGGLGLLLHAVRVGTVAAAGIVIAVALAPALLVLRGAVVTDVGLMASMLCAAGATAHIAAGGSLSWLALALPTLFYAFALRHNALPAVLPFLAAAVAAGLPEARRRAGRVTLGTLALLVAFLGANALLARSVDRHVPVWPTLAQFDLAALSISSGELLLPAFSVGPGLSVDELAAAFRPWSNTPMLQGTTHGLRDPLWTEWSQAQLAQWRHAWLSAIAQHPAAYLAHRLRLSAALFGSRAADWPRELVYVDGEMPYRDNPPVTPNGGALHGRLIAWADAWRATPVFAAWPYLLLGVAALPFALVRRRALPGRLALLFLSSAVLYAAPLVFIAPAAELRYLAWPCLASVLAAALVASAGSRRGD